MNKNDFEYKYSAPTTEERKEIENIRKSYQPKTNQTTKLERLRKLDGKVKNIPTTIGLILGIVGCLIFGLGFAMIMEWNVLAWGIVVSIIGTIAMIMTYPLFGLLSKKLKDKYGNEILTLSEELLNDDN